MADASRRQALFVAGGGTQERTQAKGPCDAPSASARLSMPAPAQGGMVLLLGRMTNADVYAQAFRDQGLDCVIARRLGLSKPPRCRRCEPWCARLPIRPIRRRALCHCSPRRCLRSAPRSSWRWRPSSISETGETSRRNIDAGIMSDFDVPGLQDLPLVTARPRGAAVCASSRGPRDSFAAIARDVVNASGWFVRLAQRGPESKAIAANVLKALDAVAEAESEFGNSPRSIALAFDRFFGGQGGPGALNEGG